MRNRTVTAIVAAGLLAGSGVLWVLDHDSRSGPHSDAPAFHARATVDAAGRVTIRSHVGVLDAGSLGGDDPSAKAATIDRLHAELRKLTAAPTPRDADGASLVTLEVEAPTGTSWPEVAWIVQVAIAPDIYIRKLRLLLAERLGDAIDHELPKDEGISMPVDPSKTIDALKFQFVWIRDAERPEGGRRVLRVAVVKEPLIHEEEDGDRPFEDETSWAEIAADYRSIRERIALATAQESGLTALVEVTPSAWTRAESAYGQVFTVLRALRDEKVTPVMLWGLLPPLPAARGGNGR